MGPWQAPQRHAEHHADDTSLKATFPPQGPSASSTSTCSSFEVSFPFSSRRLSGFSCDVTYFGLSQVQTSLHLRREIQTGFKVVLSLKIFKCFVLDVPLPALLRSARSVHLMGELCVRGHRAP